MDDRPFSGSAAVSRGELTRNDLRRRFRRLHRDVYVARDAVLTAELRARAAWLATGGTLAGLSAAAVLGTKWIDAREPAEIVRADRHTSGGLVVHSWALLPGEIRIVGGMTLTTPARTAFDIGRTRPRDVAVPMLDALARATGCTPAEVAAVADCHPGQRGVRRLRMLLPLVDGGAESPPESRVRLLLIDSGLPAPETQIEFRDQFGAVRVRVDMGWREWRVAVEYDGLQHWTNSRQRSWDIERIALLEASGWSVVRVSAEMLRRPDAIVRRVTSKLRAAGCPT